MITSLSNEKIKQIRHLKDRFGGSVVVFEANHSCFGPIGFEVENVSNFSSAPSWPAALRMTLMISLTVTAWP